MEVISPEKPALQKQAGAIPLLFRGHSTPLQVFVKYGSVVVAITAPENPLLQMQLATTSLPLLSAGHATARQVEVKKFGASAVASTIPE